MSPKIFGTNSSHVHVQSQDPTDRTSEPKSQQSNTFKRGANPVIDMSPGTGGLLRSISGAVGPEPADSAHNTCGPVVASDNMVNTIYRWYMAQLEGSANEKRFRHLDTGLKGGGVLDEIKSNLFFGTKFKRLKAFTEVVNLEANKWPPEPINKKIHMIWIGTKNISEKNIGLSIETAQKNPDYDTTIIYDSGIPGHESAKDFMTEKFNGSNVKLVDCRNESCLLQLKKEPAFAYYEKAIRDNNYAQASDLLRLLMLKFEGGIYKDIDDVQVKGFGSLAFPKGIGVMRECTMEGGKASVFNNTPIAATKENSVVNRVLKLAVENYISEETNVLKLAGPYVLTEALYQEMPGMRMKVLNQQMKQFELVKRQALGLPLEITERFEVEQLTPQEKEKISGRYEAIRGLSGYVENGADQSWVSDIPGTARS